MSSDQYFAPLELLPTDENVFVGARATQQRELRRDDALRLGEWRTAAVREQGTFYDTARLQYWAALGSLLTDDVHTGDNVQLGHRSVGSGRDVRHASLVAEFVATAFALAHVYEKQGQRQRIAMIIGDTYRLWMASTLPAGLRTARLGLLNFDGDGKVLEDAFTVAQALGHLGDATAGLRWSIATHLRASATDGAPAKLADALEMEAMRERAALATEEELVAKAYWLWATGDQSAAGEIVLQHHASDRALARLSALPHDEVLKAARRYMGTPKAWSFATPPTWSLYQAPSPPLRYQRVAPATLTEPTLVMVLEWRWRAAATMDIEAERVLDKWLAEHGWTATTTTPGLRTTLHRYGLLAAPTPTPSKGVLSWVVDRLRPAPPPTPSTSPVETMAVDEAESSSSSEEVTGIGQLLSRKPK